MVRTATRNSMRRYRWWFMGIGCAVILLVVRTCDRTRTTQLAPLVDPLPQDPTLQVFFNQSEANVYTDPYRQIARHGDDLEAQIITAIDQSSRQIDLAVQEFSLPNVAAALARAQARGVQIRIILENQYSI